MEWDSISKPGNSPRFPCILEEAMNPQSQPAPDQPHGRSAHPLLVTAGVALLHYLLAQFSLMLITRPEGISSLWLPEGFLIGVLLMRSRREWAGTLLAVFALGIAGEYQAKGDWLHAVALPMINCLEAFVGAEAVRRAMPPPYTDLDVRRMIGIILLAGVLPAAAGGVLGSLVTLADDVHNTFFSAWRIWTLATFVGTLMSLPITLTIARLARSEEHWPPQRRIEFVAMILALGVISQLIFSTSPPAFREIGPVLFVFFPFLIWAAMRFETLGAATSVLVVGLIAVSGTSGGLGPMASEVRPEFLRVLHLQAFLLVAASSTHILAALSAERQGGQRRLGLAEARHRTLVEQASDGIFLADNDGYCIEVNKAGCFMLGYTREELIGKRADQFIDPEDLRHTPWRLELLKRGKSLIAERQLIRKDGTRIPVEINAKPLPDGRLIAVCRDLSERRKHESVLNALVTGTSHDTGERFFRSLCASVSEALGVCCTLVCELGPGRTLQSLAISHNGQDVPTRQFPFEGSAMARAIENGSEIVMDRARERYPADATLAEAGAESFVGVAMRDAGGVPIGLLAVMDVKPLANVEPTTSVLSIFASRAGAELLRLRSERALRHGEARLAALLNAIPDTLFVMTLDGVYVDYRTHNPSRLLLPPNEFLGRSYRDVMPPPLLAEFDKAFVQLRKGKTPKVIEYSSDQFGELRFYEVRHSNVGDELVLAILRDVTERKTNEAEIRRLNEDLERLVQARTAQFEAANQELESFAYTVSHDLRAPLRAIHANAEMLREDLGEKATEDEQENLSRIVARAEEMSDLIDGLLKLSRIMRAEISTERVDLSAAAREIAESLDRSSSGRAVRWAIEDGLEANGDAVLLSALLRNLLDNAFKFTSKTPKAVIEFSARNVEGEIVYFVRDNGAGFDPKHADKLFGAFERLHAPGEFSGTGIGLATVQRIVRRHGGRIWAEGEVGKGATFYFTLEDPEAE
jgi:PAS domain S-box-containing protein